MDAGTVLKTVGVLATAIGPTLVTVGNDLSKKKKPAGKKVSPPPVKRIEPPKK